MVWIGVLIALLLATTAHAQTLVSANRVSMPVGNPNSGFAIFQSTASTVALPTALATNQWHTIEMPNLPPTTVAVQLAGILVITNATNISTPALCDVQVTFRAPGNTLASGNYQMQALAGPGDGARSNATVTVQVIDRKFEVFWKYTPACGALPSATAINLTAQQVFWNDAEGTPPTTGGRWFRVCDISGCYAGSLVLVP